MKLHPISAAVTLLLGSLLQIAHADDVRRPYIVQLTDKPVASYTGGVSGLAATQPPAGQRIVLDTSAVNLYTDYLVHKQATVKAAVPSAPILYDYQIALNGFAAMLTDDEVRTLQANSGVASITADTPRAPTTNYTPTFLGLDGPNGLWAQMGGKDKAGENVVIGIIDGGIWPENPSYADRVDANGVPTFDPNATLAYSAPQNWNGTCQTGEGFTVADCNNKLIGARYFNTGFKAQGLVQHWTDFTSPRDSIGGTLGHGGHGTHTSSTAGGNNNVPAQLSGIPMGNVSGMAPRARIAMYKVCWSYNDASDPTGALNRCWGSDSAAAIERAILDGANVLNYSIGGGTVLNDVVEQAFLHASNAGLFVAASAGNDGPAPSAGHLSPWLTTVGASTHNRFLKADVKLGSGVTYSGASLNINPLPDNTPIIRSEDAAVAGAAPGAVQLCYSKGWNGGVAVLDPAKVSGKIVTCVRGTNDRIDKSRAVAEAGGVGMVMVDNGGGLVAEIHSVPTVHVSAADGALIKAYAASKTGTAGLSHFVNAVGSTPAPVMASFSSRGPNSFDGNVLKPDVTAPGVDILAGVTPELTAAQKANVINGTLRPDPAWNLYQGTSMASPHVAGVAALLHQRHPDWSPAAIKSALMTSATPTYPDTASGDQRGILPFAQGAGHINPTGSVIHRADGKAYNAGGADDPGLVFDLGPNDYKKYLCGAGYSSECSAGTMAGYALNLPSITLNNVLGSITVSRSVTNVSGEAESYAIAPTLSGYTVSASPATLAVGPGETKSFSVTLTRGSAPDNVWQYGDVTLSSSKHVVRIPLTARSGKPLVAPVVVASIKPSGNVMFSVTTGFAGRMSASTAGLKAITKSGALSVARLTTSVGSIADMQAACNSGATGTTLVPFTFPASTVAASFELFDADTGAPGHEDIDMLLLTGNGQLVDYSASDGSNEAILLTAPPAGSYKVCVLGYAPANGVSTTFKLSSAVVSTADTGGNLKVLLPSQVYAGGSATVATTWSGLASGNRYLGGVQLKDPTGNPVGATAVLVETNSPIPLAKGTAKATRLFTSSK
ncbi:S8 family peptidase [Duganella callida]|uniref:Peptidase S8 and S53 subtilisin kexin sedolisin n=1 Tax=Duganella callida TaxID=2561932 RepID=A0A4Y9S5R5_9BURK|nr:S8 family peptidase [Duganella callida]TFW16878.1 peptidase S8 and S53 subtilisin kexin sedolisin [Duganella callida]